MSFIGFQSGTIQIQNREVCIQYKLLIFELLINEGLRAKRAYIEFWPIFIFLQDRADFWQTDLF